MEMVICGDGGEGVEVNKVFLGVKHVMVLSLYQARMCKKRKQVPQEVWYTNGF